MNSALEYQLKPLQKFGVQVLEAAEQLAAMKAWQEGDKDHLRAWIKERNGGKPDSILSAQLTNDVPPIKDDTDAGRIITILLPNHKHRGTQISCSTL